MLLTTIPLNYLMILYTKFIEITMNGSLRLREVLLDESKIVIITVSAQGSRLNCIISDIEYNMAAR